MTARISTEQADVLEASAAWLRNQVEELGSESVCFVSAWPMPPHCPPGNLFATIAPTDGTFDQDLLEGGGANTACENAGVVVTVFSRCKLDRAGQSNFLLSDQGRGLLRLKKKILKAFTSHDLEFERSLILRNQMAPLRSTAGDYNEQQSIGWLSVTFSTDFDWALT